MKALIIAVILIIGCYAQVDSTITKLENSKSGKRMLDTI